MNRIAILETGAPPPALAAAHGDYPAMFRDLLGEGFSFETFDVQAGEWPEAGAFDAAIITGSSAGVYETDGWIADLLDWIRAAKGRTKLVGVCFGHQAMARGPAVNAAMEPIMAIATFAPHLYEAGEVIE